MNGAKSCLWEMVGCGWGCKGQRGVTPAGVGAHRDPCGGRSLGMVSEWEQRDITSRM